MNVNIEIVFLDFLKNDFLDLAYVVYDLYNRIVYVNNMNYLLSLSCSLSTTATVNFHLWLSYIMMNY